MASFQYRARDKSGSLVVGTLDGADTAEVETALEKMGLIPIRVASKAGSGAFTRLNNYFKKVTPVELILFSRQLSTLFGAGVPLTKALGTLEEQLKGPKFPPVIKKIREDVEGGSTFSDAIRKHPEVFPELYSNMVEAGEAGGILDEVLDRLAVMLEKDEENRAKIKSATLYPKIVVAAIILAVLIIMNFVIPKFAKLYKSFDIELPLPTRMLIAASDWFTAYWYVLAALSVGIFLAIKLYLSTTSGRLFRDRFILRVPLFGPLILKSILTRFSRILGSLYKSGLPILQSLDIVSRAVENRLIASVIKDVENEVRAGKGLAEPMTATRRFPPMVVQMVTVGEETGKLDEMLEKVAEYYDKEVDSTIRNLTTTLEPVLLAFIFVLVLFLALAIFLPMWDIIKVVKR